MVIGANVLTRLYWLFDHRSSKSALNGHSSQAISRNACVELSTRVETLKAHHVRKKLAPKHHQCRRPASPHWTQHPIRRPT